MYSPSHLPEDEPVTFLSQDAPFRQITEVCEYRFNDICPEDIVVDIGANVGAFCIRAARRARNVTAVEPVTAALLRNNIRANSVSVRVVDGALGNGKPALINWDEQRVSTATYTLKMILEQSGGCDFLKCDCEGAEWLINPPELAGIRRIEMEMHQPPIGGRPNPALLDYIGKHYDFEIDRKPVHAALGVMGVLHAVLR
ncbi:MAG: FkbM family methyltransferase [Methanoregula sp.]|nr:FkbM family methyltransferase [Methanoregula sp.]